MKFRDEADYKQPFEFYAHILSAQGGWRHVLERLGLDAADPIDEFMNAALEYETDHTPSLEGFLHWIETTDAEIKRDQDRTIGAVRVMTVHAAKGLEAPVVILPDHVRRRRAAATISVDGGVCPVLAPSSPHVKCPRGARRAMPQNFSA